ncbi:uncharacterized protein [Rutidosis leptorrhynchoides]|uniref:uncharacterized protein n=1 Tax=Rutidosis leptorrhynchoides TaxID=125765 RepID=UPI003A98DAD7
MKQPSNTDDDECYAFDHIDLSIDEELEKLLGVDTTGFNQICENEIVDLEADFRELMNFNVDECELESETPQEESFEAIPNEDRFRIKSSWEEPPTLELKELPEHLEYAYLKELSQILVIISSRLTDDQKSKLVLILKSHHKAIAWKTMYIPGINTSYCTHKILMEENFKPVVQRQWRLNPNTKEVMNKEVIKLLDTGLIYPISNSPWDFSKIAHPMTKLLEKDKPFLFDDECTEAFNLLKEKLTNPPIIISPDWSKDFELMCDASDYALEAVLGTDLFQRGKKCPKPGSKYVRYLMCGGMGPFPSSNKCLYILVVVDYVSKWAETKALLTNDAKVVIKFLKSLFARFGVPMALISNRGTHFANHLMEKVIEKYGVTHRLSTPYHPQTSGQVENTNHALKRILEKTVNNNPKVWSTKLNDALWAF